MSDPSLTYEKLLQIEEALQRVDRRFSSIKSPTNVPELAIAIRTMIDDMDKG